MLFLSTLPHRPWPHFTSWHFRLLILSLTKCSPMYLVLHSKNTPRPILIHAFVLSCFSCVWLFVTQWTLARQAPLSTGFSRQEYWSGLPCPPPGDLPNPGIESRSPALQGSLYCLSHQGNPLKALHLVHTVDWFIIIELTVSKQCNSCLTEAYLTLLSS